MTPTSRFLLAAFAFLSVCRTELNGSRLTAVFGYGGFPTTARANVRHVWRLPESSNRSGLEWGVGLDWAPPIRTEIYYGQLPAVIDVTDLINERGEFLGPYRTELHVDYVGVPVMYRLPLYRAGNTPPNQGVSDRSIRFIVNALVGPRADLYLARYMGGFGDSDGWAYGHPDAGRPRVDSDIPVIPAGLGAEAALEASLMLGRLLIAPGLRLHVNFVNPAVIGFVSNVLVPTAAVGIGYAL